MRLLLIADSHGHGMEKALTTQRPDLVMLSIIVGSQSGAIQAQYARRLSAVQRFRPDAIIVHFGHNDMVLHPRHNPTPYHGKYFFPTVLGFVQVLRANHPLSRIIYSSPFPRTMSATMTVSQRFIYNRVAVRFGAMSRSSANQEGYECVLNSGLWLRVRKWIERPGNFLPDGLHLNPEGQRIVAEGWIAKLYPAENVEDDR